MMGKNSGRLSVQWLNGMALSSPERLVSISEHIYNRQIEKTASEILSERERFSILLVSGPSASTKTTTAAKLSHTLRQNGVPSAVISLDNFFLNRADLPVLPDGSVDYESIRTLDLTLLSRCFGELLAKGFSDFPVFDFKAGKRSGRTERIEAPPGGIVLVEGIHALNPAILRDHDAARFRRLYISPNSYYFLGEELVLGVRDLRLIRRLVRDYFHRASSVNSTLDMWTNVVKNESANILPYREEADYVLDSVILYEPNIYEACLNKVLCGSGVSEVYRPKIEALRGALEQFVPLDMGYVPADTVLREFLE